VTDVKITLSAAHDKFLLVFDYGRKQIRQKIGCQKNAQPETIAQQMHAGSASLHPNCFRSFLTPATSACIKRWCAIV